MSVAILGRARCMIRRFVCVIGGVCNAAAVRRGRMLVPPVLALQMGKRVRKAPDLPEHQQCTEQNSKSDAGPKHVLGVSDDLEGSLPPRPLPMRPNRNFCQALLTER